MGRRGWRLVSTERTGPPADIVKRSPRIPSPDPPVRGWVAVPPLKDGVYPLDIWVSTLCFLKIGANILCGHLRLTLIFLSEISTYRPCQGIGHVLVVVRLEEEVSMIVNQTEILLIHPLVSGCAIS